MLMLVRSCTVVILCCGCVYVATDCVSLCCMYACMYNAVYVYICLCVYRQYVCVHVNVCLCLCVLRQYGAARLVRGPGADASGGSTHDRGSPGAEDSQVRQASEL